MRKTSVVSLMTLFLLAVATAFAQQTKPPAKEPAPVRTEVAEMLAQWNNIGNEVIKMAEDFPEDKYAFKVQKDQRTFAENLLHIAGVDYLIISAVKGSQMGPNNENPSGDGYKTKADIVKFVKAAVADGAAVITEQADGGLDKVSKYAFGNRMVHNWFQWVSAIEHSGEHYGQLVVYYRANNMVPPASRGQ